MTAELDIVALRARIILVRDALEKLKDKAKQKSTQSDGMLASSAARVGWLEFGVDDAVQALNEALEPPEDRPTCPELRAAVDTCNRVLSQARDSERSLRTTRVM